jgi:hypothetical protein
MMAALPMDPQLDRLRRIARLHDHFLDHETHDLFLDRCVGLFNGGGGGGVRESAD